MTLFDKGPLEEVVAEKVGYMNYVSASWDRLDSQPGVQRRQVSYQLNRQINQFGSKVSCIQQKTVSDDLDSCVLDEVLTLHDVPFGDHFQVTTSSPFAISAFNLKYSPFFFLFLQFCFFGNVTHES